MNPKKKKKFPKLIGLRAELGLTQVDMGNIIGCTSANYGAKEKGDTNLYLEEAMTITKELNKLLKKNGRETLTMEQIFFS